MTDCAPGIKGGSKDLDSSRDDALPDLCDRNKIELENYSARNECLYSFFKTNKEELKQLLDGGSKNVLI